MDGSRETIGTYLRLIYLCFIILKFLLVIGLKHSVHCVYVINKVSTMIIFCQTPFEFLFHVFLMYAYFQPFSCRVFLCLRPYVKNKFNHGARHVINVKHEGKREYFPPKVQQRK